MNAQKALKSISRQLARFAVYDLDHPSLRNDLISVIRQIDAISEKITALAKPPSPPEVTLSQNCSERLTINPEIESKFLAQYVPELEIPLADLSPRAPFSPAVPAPVISEED